MTGTLHLPKASGGCFLRLPFRVPAARATASEKDFLTGMQNVTKIAAMGKCFATDTAMEVATDAVQVFGGYGFMEDYPIAKFFRDAKILSIYEGTNQVQRMVVARILIKESEQLRHLEDYIPREEQKSYRKAETPAKP